MLNTPLHKRESNILADGGCAMVVVSAERAKKMGKPAAYKLGESVRVCRQAGRQDDLQGILHYYALILEFVGSHEEALLALQEEEAICRELGDSEALSACLEKQKAIRREMMGR